MNVSGRHALLVRGRQAMGWCLALSLLVAGCNSIGGQQAKQPPVASAGVDQSALAGDQVSLYGSESSDPAGKPLTFKWEQIGGTQVALTGDDTAFPSFIAPDAAGVVTFRLTVDNGEQTAQDDASVFITTEPDVDTTGQPDVDTTGTPEPKTGPILYVTNRVARGILSWDISDPNNINGNIPPDANLSGAQTQFLVPMDLTIDNSGSLLVVSSLAAGPRVTSYKGADDLTGINGNVAPDRNLQGAATGFGVIAAMDMQIEKDMLFVSEVFPRDVVYVFADASTSALNGNKAPVRTIASAALVNPYGISHAQNDDLYIANSGPPSNVLVFADSSTINGTVNPTRVLTSAAFGNVLDVFYKNADDTLFVLNSTLGGNRVLVFRNASTLNGIVTPDSILTIQGATALTGVHVDSLGTGYVSDGGTNAVYSFDNIANLNGTFAPDRTLQGANTLLGNPGQIFILE